MRAYNSAFNKKEFFKAGYFLNALLVRYDPDSASLSALFSFLLCLRNCAAIDAGGPGWREEGRDDWSRLSLPLIKEMIENAMSLAKGFWKGADANLLNLAARALGHLKGDSRACAIIYENLLAFNAGMARAANILREGMAWYTWNEDLVPFNLPFLKLLPPWSVSIVFGKDSPEIRNSLHKWGLNNYEVLFGCEKLDDFGIIVADMQDAPLLKKTVNFDRKLIITHGHGLEYRPWHPYDPHLFIGSTENQTLPFCEYRLEKEQGGELAHLPVSAKCEYAYTGPYYVDNLAARPGFDKLALKNEVAAGLGLNLSPGQKLVLWLDDAMSPREQQIRAINALAEKHLVIFKLIFKPLKPEEEAALAPNARALFGAWNNNRLRFAADFIFCGYSGSTCLSSILLGLRFAPFYAPTIVPAWDPKPKSWRSRLPAALQMIDPSALQIFNASYPYFFNIFEPERLKWAVDDPAYGQWLDAILASLRKKIFGDYDASDPAARMARYICEFASKGTLGADCVGFNKRAGAK